MSNLSSFKTTLFQDFKVPRFIGSTEVPLLKDTLYSMYREDILPRKDTGLGSKYLE